LATNPLQKEKPKEIVESLSLLAVKEAKGIISSREDVKGRLQLYRFSAVKYK